MEDFTKVYRNDDPLYHNPRHQRRVLAVWRPIEPVENLHEVGLECGHVPVMMGDDVPAVGDMLFCPTCYEEGKEK